jgi:hypothetical protein
MIGGGGSNTYSRYRHSILYQIGFSAFAAMETMLPMGIKFLQIHFLLLWRLQPSEINIFFNLVGRKCCQYFLVPCYGSCLINGQDSFLPVLSTQTPRTIRKKSNLQDSNCYQWLFQLNSTSVDIIHHLLYTKNGKVRFPEFSNADW